MESITISDIMPVSPERLYTAWLDADQHSVFTDGEAECNPVVGGEFSAFDDYIEGINLELNPYKRILQSWRTTDFSDDDENSLLEILFESVDNGTRITLNHTNIPDGQGESYKQGWQDYYFMPMKEFFINNP